MCNFRIIRKEKKTIVNISFYLSISIIFGQWKENIIYNTKHYTFQFQMFIHFDIYILKNNNKVNKQAFV